MTNQNSIQDETKFRLKAGNSCYYSVQTLLSQLLSKNMKIKIYETIILPVVLNSCKTVSYIKGGIQAKGICKQDPEANIWTQEGSRWEVEEAPN